MWPLGLETILNGLLWDMVESFLTLKYTMSYFDKLEIWRFFTCVLTVGYPSWYMYLCVMIVYIWILFFHPDSFIFGHLKLIQCCSRRVCYTLRCLTLQHRMSSVTFSFVFSMRSCVFGYVILYRSYSGRLSLLSPLLWRWIHYYCSFDNRSTTGSRRDYKCDW